MSETAPARAPRLDAFETIYQVARMTFRRSIGGRRFFLALAMVALPLVLSFGIGRQADPNDQAPFFYVLIVHYHFRIAVPAVALILASAFPWPESDDGTLTYWFTAPVARWAVSLGRFAAALLIGLLVLPLSVLALGLPLQPPAGAELGPAMRSAVTATLLAYPAYLALMRLMTTTFRHALVFGVIFVVVENVLSFIQGSLARVTIIYYVRGLLQPDFGRVGREALELIGGGQPIGPVYALVTLLTVAVIGLVLSLLLVSVIEYRGKHAQTN